MRFRPRTPVHVNDPKGLAKPPAKKQKAEKSSGTDGHSVRGPAPAKPPRKAAPTKRAAGRAGAKPIGPKPKPTIAARKSAPNVLSRAQKAQSEEAAECRGGSPATSLSAVTAASASGPADDETNSVSESPPPYAESDERAHPSDVATSGKFT